MWFAVFISNVIFRVEKVSTELSIDPFPFLIGPSITEDTGTCGFLHKYIRISGAP